MFETPHRAQTEPLAALAAVVIVAIAIGIYGAYIADVLPGSSQNTVEEPTIQRIWAEISTSGIYDSTDNPWNDVDDDGRYDSVATPLDTLDEETLPRGSKVYMTVSTVNESHKRVVLAEALYDERAIQVPPGPDEPPDEGHAISRPIAIRVSPGDIRAGTLRVVVW